MTDAERRLWRELRFRQGGVQFRRQAVVGDYIVDFVCYEKKIVVELDGGQHSEQKEYDAERTAWLQSQGYNVFRFWNHEVLGEMDAVKSAIYDAINGPASSPHPTLPHKGGGNNGHRH